MGINHSQQPKSRVKTNDQLAHVGPVSSEPSRSITKTEAHDHLKSLKETLANELSKIKLDKNSLLISLKCESGQYKFEIATDLAILSGRSLPESITSLLAERKYKGIALEVFEIPPAEHQVGLQALGSLRGDLKELNRAGHATKGITCELAQGTLASGHPFSNSYRISVTVLSSKLKDGMSDQVQELLGARTYKGVGLTLTVR